ncbi:hypothetical protein [Natronomonas sp.]|uniref:hypothetical protein n=1 Tax=Natronomonas sp. TaxID=2184060 RepID=UPI002633FAD3|nr:hypothetical protein [Natronomonas sp.]
MATESAADGELSVTLSPPLSAWLDERAAELGVDRETLLVRLLGAHRAVSDVDDDDLSALVSDAIEDAEIEPADIDAIEGRIDDVERSLSDHVEDLRSRILQLKEGVEDAASADHGHAEIDELSGRVGELSADTDRIGADVESIGDELGGLASEVDGLAERIEDTETKLDRLARAVVVLKRRADGIDGTSGALGSIREDANRNGTTSANCESCGESVRIGLLSEPACPHCEHRFDGIEYDDSVLRRWRTPKLVDSGADPEDDPGADGTAGTDDE